MTGRDGFAQVLRGELTKLRTVRSTVWCVLAVVGLTVLLSTLATSVGRTNDTGPTFVDQFHFVHQPSAGDATVVARVVSQERSHEWAKAGIMIKAGAAHGSPYAALMVTPGHGVRLESTFDTDIPGSADAAPRWLRLTRAGAAITGYESADGTTWRQVGRIDVGALPHTAEAGLFVSSPPRTTTEKIAGGGNVQQSFSTIGTAVFDQVSGTGLAPDRWIDDIVRADSVLGPARPGRSSRSGGAPSQ